MAPLGLNKLKHSQQRATPCIQWHAATTPYPCKINRTKTLSIEFTKIWLFEFSLMQNRRSRYKFLRIYTARKRNFRQISTHKGTYIIVQSSATITRFLGSKKSIALYRSPRYSGRVRDGRVLAHFQTTWVMSDIRASQIYRINAAPNRCNS